MKRARFISIENESVDLVLSFALEDEALGIRSLILMRTPKFEHLIPEEERGVWVSLEGQEKYGENDMLVRAVLSSEAIEITTESGKYRVDLSKIDEEDFNSVYPFLQKMNFDKKFEVSHA